MAKGIIIHIVSIMVLLSAMADADMTTQTQGSFRLMGMQIADINSTLMIKGDKARNFSENVTGAFAPS